MSKRIVIRRGSLNHTPAVIRLNRKAREAVFYELPLNSWFQYKGILYQKIGAVSALQGVGNTVHAFTPRTVVIRMSPEGQ